MKLSSVFILLTTGLNCFQVRAEQESDQQAEAAEDQDHQSQNFFPSFSPFSNPGGHSRPFFFQQEGAYSQRPSAYQQQLGYETPKYLGYKGDGFDNRAAIAEATETHALLGSGNFGVISGGTFYNDKDKQGSEYDSSDHYDSYYQNGHGRPAFYVGKASNPRPRKQEQFADFKDFADINVASNPAFSHIVVVYANQNGTVFHTPTEMPAVEPTKKASKSKRKLALLRPEKKIRLKKSQLPKYADDSEPMLALS